MKILMISPQYKPVCGGYENSCERLSIALTDMGNNVTVISERRQRSWAAQEDANGISIRRWWCIYEPGLHTLTSLLGFLWQVLASGRRFDVWHIHQYGIHATLAILLAHALRRPVALKITNTESQGIQKALSTAKLSSLQKWAHKRVTACIAVSGEAVSEAEMFGIPRSRIFRVANGVDTSIFRPSTLDERQRIRRSLKLDCSDNIALYAGRLAHEKNPLSLLRAWAIVKRDLTEPWKLAMVGNGPLEESVRQEVKRLGLDGDVILPGKTNSPEDWFRASDLFLLTSSNEGMSNALLEAMACGLPSIVTDVSGTKELVRQPQTGLVVPRNDEGALAGAILSLQSDLKQRQEMGLRARDEILNHFDLSIVAVQIHQIYVEMIKQDWK
jgi:glycosyltransferase involved in cell wall biosynthesis